MSSKEYLILTGVIGLFAAHAAILYFMGQPAMCACGHIDLWHGIVTDSENSQHLFDWYSLSHVIHGILFYAFFTVLFPRLPVGYRLFLSVGLEAAWELVENSPWIINRYREQALAQGYFGDSIVNSLGDGFAALCGFLFASRSRIWMSIAVVIALELLALYAIRDNLTLNIIQLLHPIDAIGAWQAAE